MSDDFHDQADPAMRSPPITTDRDRDFYSTAILKELARRG